MGLGFGETQTRESHASSSAKRGLRAQAGSGGALELSIPRGWEGDRITLLPNLSTHAGPWVALARPWSSVLVS